MKTKSILTILALVLQWLALPLAITTRHAKTLHSQEETNIQAALGTAFTYQGQLKSEGDPVSGTCDFQFSLWDASSGGTRVGETQTKVNISVNSGYFTIPDLDFGSNAFTGDARWLAIAVRCPAGSRSYTGLSPRQALTAVPYALSLHPGAVVNGSRDTTILSLSGGAIGLNASGIQIGVRGWSASMGSWGVYGLSNGDNGRGVVGTAGATSGPNYGVYGQSYSADGYGVYGYASAAMGNGYGVFGESDSYVGVYGHSKSTLGRGVIGRVTANSGDTIGVLGYSDSIDGIGSYGYAPVYGVYGESSNPGGRGVLGYAADKYGDSIGVFGQSESTVGTGVFGWASKNSGTNFGVYGVAFGPSGKGGYFWNGVHVEGPLTVTGSKSFKIDHPLDPSNRYLYHFVQEGPEVQNVYNGVIILDSNGQANVTLPDYFSALNAGPYRYQLTPIGAPMPNLYIAKEIDDNQFTIAGGVPDKKVSWEVTAVRNDPYLRDHSANAEQDKPTNEQGTYLYPEGYGQPQEMGLDHQRLTRFLKRTPEIAPFP